MEARGAIMTRWGKLNFIPLLFREQFHTSSFPENCTNRNRAGVPQVILPQWVDLYDYASLVEGLNIGTWGCRETSPNWTAECLQEAVLLSVNGSQASTMAKNAAAFGELARRSLGRDVAAREVERLAASGYA